MSEPNRPSVRVDVETVRVRRAPRYPVFLVVGALLGVVVAAILTLAFHGSDQASPNTGVVYSATQVFGFVSLVCAPIGIAVGGLVAVILDARSSRRIRSFRAGHQSVHGSD
ncbi:potassium transporter Trk [Microbacterium sp. NPDC091313]